MFNQPIGDWNTATATTMRCMSKSTSGLNQSIGDWSTTAVDRTTGASRYSWGLPVAEKIAHVMPV